MMQACKLCLSLMFATLCGCSSLDATSLFGKQKFVEAGPKNPVVDVVCLWEPAEGRGLDNLPGRGFAGQILFLTRGNPEPAMIGGDVRVYVFDNQGPLDEQSKPLHQYDFKGEAFSQYLCETNIGAAYQIFIPYPRKGAHEAKCSLRVRFTPAGGGSPVYSKMTDLTLPGAKPTETATSWQPQRRRSHTAAGNQTSEPPTNGEVAQRRSTPSIPLTSHRRTMADANATRARLQQVAAKLAEETDVIQPASYETDKPAPRRYQLHDRTP